MNNEDITTSTIGASVGILTHTLGSDIFTTLLAAFISGFVSIAGKEFFKYLKNDKNEKP